MNRKLILGLAVALPLLPIVEWVVSGVRDIGAIGVSQAPLSLLVLYYPARVLGLVGFVLMFYQFLLSARLPALQKVFKQPNLLKTHRSLGKLGFVLIALHGVMMLASDGVEYGRIAFTTEKLLGIGALFLLVIAVVAAWWMKPLQFSMKTWKRFHILAYLVFPLAFFHAITIGTVAAAWSPTRVLFILFFAGYLYVLGRKLISVFRGHSSPGGSKTPAQTATSQTEGSAG